MTLVSENHLVSLPEAASELHLHRATVNAMVRDGRIPAIREGAHWFIHRKDLDEFAGTYERPANSPPRDRSSRALSGTGITLMGLLLEWDSATVDEVQLVTGLHPGNIRKNFRILEALHLAERGSDGKWRATDLAKSTTLVATEQTG